MRAEVRAVALALAGLAAWPSGGAAQAITPDTLLGRTTGTIVDNGGPNYTISGGQVRGTNLFHSFNTFGVPTGGSATFVQPDPSGPAVPINNVLNRVTGGFSSFIDGTISTRALDTPGVSTNFFLINPSGVMFGANALLDVSGAVRVSTADYLRLDNGAVFSATNPSEVPSGVLFSAPPQAFGFLPSNPFSASITVDGAILLVDPGQTLSLVGGDIEVRSGVATDTILWAPGGQVELISVRSPGTVDLTAADFGLESFSRLGRITISSADVFLAGVTAGGDFGLPGGTVVIRSGQLVAEGPSTVVLSENFDAAGAATGLDIRSTDSIVVRNGASLRTVSSDSANASDISVHTGSLSVTDSGTIESLALSSGITGNVNVQVGRVDILSGGSIKTVASASNAADVTVVASGVVNLAGAGSEISTGAGAGSGSVIAGNISVSAADVVLTDGARIRSGSTNEEAGQRVSVTATNSVSISGLAGISSQAFAQTAGAIDISAQRLIMDAGFINTSTLGVGGAGQVLVNANTVSLTNGAQIASSSQNSATSAPANCCPGGSITINAPSALTISGVGPANGVGSITFTGIPNSGVLSTTVGEGNAGQIILSTPALTLADGGRISVATSAAGNAGTIVANVGNFGITGGARVDSSTTAGGAGGAIAVNGTLSVSGAESGLFSTASSTGNA